MKCPNCGNVLIIQKPDFPRWAEALAIYLFIFEGCVMFSEIEMKCSTCSLKGMQKSSLTGTIIFFLIFITPIALTLILTDKFELSFLMGALSFVGFSSIAAIIAQVLVPMFALFEPST